MPCLVKMSSGAHELLVRFTWIIVNATSVDTKPARKDFLKMEGLSLLPTERWYDLTEM